MASAFAVADSASLAGESSARLVSNKYTQNEKQTDAEEACSTVRYNYRSYGSPALNRAIAKSLGDSAEYLPEVNMVRMRVS